MGRCNLDENDELFCQLLVNGGAPYGGDPQKCYQEVYHNQGKLSAIKAQELLKRDEIRDYIEQLESENAKETSQVKKFLSENLKSIIRETTTAEYTDRKGRKLSVAPLRSVAVSASKALMELYPVREAQVNKLNIEGNGEGGVVFNVIVPGAQDNINAEEK